MLWLFLLIGTADKSNRTQSEFSEKIAGWAFIISSNFFLVVCISKLD